MRNYKNRQYSDINEKIKSGRYRYENGKLYDTKLKMDVSDRLKYYKPSDNDMEKHEEVKETEPIKENKDIETKEETVEEKSSLNREFDGQYFDKIYLSDSNIIMIAFAKNNFDYNIDTDITHYRINKSEKFTDVISDKIHGLPKLDYSPEKITSNSSSYFSFELLNKIMSFFHEFSTKNKMEIDRVKLYVRNNYPLSIMAEYNTDYKYRILAILANRIE